MLRYTSTFLIKSSALKTVPRFYCRWKSNKLNNKLTCHSKLYTSLKNIYVCIVYENKVNRGFFLRTYVVALEYSENNNTICYYTLQAAEYMMRLHKCIYCTYLQAQ